MQRRQFYPPSTHPSVDSTGCHIPHVPSIADEELEAITPVVDGEVVDTPVKAPKVARSVLWRAIDKLPRTELQYLGGIIEEVAHGPRHAHVLLAVPGDAMGRTARMGLEGSGGAFASLFKNLSGDSTPFSNIDGVKAADTPDGAIAQYQSYIQARLSAVIQNADVVQYEPEAQSVALLEQLAGPNTPRPDAPCVMGALSITHQGHTGPRISDVLPDDGDIRSVKGNLSEPERVASVIASNSPSGWDDPERAAPWLTTPAFIQTVSEYVTDTFPNAHVLTSTHPLGEFGIGPGANSLNTTQLRRYLWGLTSPPEISGYTVAVPFAVEATRKTNELDVGDLCPQPGDMSRDSPIKSV